MMETLEKRACSFLIHRYLRDFLKSKINLEAMSVDLSKGETTVREIDMDVELMNEALKSANVPLNVVEGYIGEVSVSVPWRELKQKSCEIQITDLQLTLQPLEYNGHDMNQADLVSSMLSSMGSLASSIDIAKSLKNEELQQKDIEDYGVEQFAEVIDSILSRFRLVFMDTTIRLENEPDPESRLCTALEVQIDWIEFIDEQLNACQTHDAPMDAITSQPHSLSAIPDLNKLFHLKGIRFYTDVFSRPESELVADDDNNSSSQVITSMYIRREKERTKRKTSSIESVTAVGDDVLGNMEESATSSVLAHSSISDYHSCYSKLDASEMSQLSPPGQLSPSSEARPVGQLALPKRLESNPILIAQFVDADEKQKPHTIRLRIRNNQLANGCAFANKEIELFFGGLNVLLTPSQLYIVNSLLGKLIFPSSLSETTCGHLGKPMISEDFGQVKSQLEQCTNSPQYSRPSDFELGNWVGPMQFYDAQREPLNNSLGAMTNVSLNANPSSMRSNGSSVDEYGNGNKHRHYEAAATGTGRVGVSDKMQVKVTLANLIFVMTHKDALGYESMSVGALNEREQVMGVIRRVESVANRFFERAAGIQFSSRSRLAGIRERCDGLYEDDHLRLMAAGVTLMYVLERGDNSENNLMMSCTMANVDCVEVLGAESASSTKTEHIELLSFCSVTDEKSNDGNPHLRLQIDNQTNGQSNYAIQLELAPCTTELDISILDRLSPLLFTKPFFTFSFGLNDTRSCYNAQPLDLKEDIFMNTIGDGLVPLTSSAASVVSFVMRCSEWKVVLRIPMADLRDAVSVNARAPYWLRRVHRERLELELSGGVMEMRDLMMAQWSGSVAFSADSMLGRFVDGEKGASLECSEEEQLFVYAGSSSGKAAARSGGSTESSRVSVNVSYDFRNKSLKSNAGIMNNSDDVTQRSGQWASYFKTNSKVEGGPFSHTVTVHENEPVTMVGSRKELNEFAVNCMNISSVKVEVTMPVMRVNLPNHHFYEVLYNRLVNDLALWEPSSQLFKNTSVQSAGVNINAPISDDVFQMCSCPNIRKESEIDLSDAEGDGSHGTAGTSRSQVDGSGSSSDINESQNHRICVQLKCTDGKVLIGASMSENKTACAQSQIASELSVMQLFVVNGYHGNNDLTYFYFTAGQVAVFHRNLLEGVAAYERNVQQKNFATRSREDVRVEAMERSGKGEVRGDTLCELIEDDNVAVAIRMDFHSDTNVKNVLVATALRNSQINLMPFADAGHFWLGQLAEFFSVVDYAIPGYDLPEITMELHLHMVSTMLAYDHCCVKPDSAIRLRLVLGSCNVNSRIVQNAEVYKFECLFEETKLFLDERKEGKSTKRNSVKFEGDSRRSPNGYGGKYVQMLSMGLFQIEVRAAAHKQLKCPLIEVKCKNDLVKVWTCADSLVTLINVLTELRECDLMRKSKGSAASRDSGREPVNEKNDYSAKIKHSEVSCAQNELRERGVVDTIRVSSTADRQLRVLQDMVQSAITSSPMRGTPSISSGRGKDGEGVEFGGDAVVEQLGSLDSCKKSLINDALNDFDDSTVFDNDRQRSVSSGTDEGFCVVDEIPGSGITNVGGEPRIRLLSDDVKLVDNWFEIPNEHYNDDILRLPSDFATPLIRYIVRDVSLLVHLYGGNDFGDKKRAPKTYSCEEFRYGYGPGQRLEADATGGVNRDHSVHVEIQLSKMSFVYQMFGADASILSMNLLTVHEIEMRDKLALSQINKMLYQYASGQLPRRTCAPMFALRLVETHQNEGKMKLSMLPIRLNCDQDTLEFLVDFTNEVSANLIALQAGANGSSASRLSDQVIMEVAPNIRRDGTTAGAGVRAGADESELMEEARRGRARSNSSRRKEASGGDSTLSHSVEKNQKLYPKVPPPPLTPSRASCTLSNQIAASTEADARASRGSESRTGQDYAAAADKNNSGDDVPVIIPAAFISTTPLSAGGQFLTCSPSNLATSTGTPPQCLVPELGDLSELSSCFETTNAVEAGNEADNSGNTVDSLALLSEETDEERRSKGMLDDSKSVDSPPLIRLSDGEDEDETFDSAQQRISDQDLLRSRFAYQPEQRKMVMRESAIGQQQQQDGGSARNRMIESDGWDHSEGGTGAGAGAGAADSAGSGELTSSSTTPASWALSASPASLQSASSSRSSSPTTQQQPKHKPNQRAHSSSSSPRSQHCTDCTARDGIVTNQKHDEVRLMQMDGRNIVSVDEMLMADDFGDAAGGCDSETETAISHGSAQQEELRDDELGVLRDDALNTSARLQMLATEQSSSSYDTAIRRETFFKEFSFSPAVTIILDYEGKRVKTEQGTLIGLLIGLSNLQCTRLELKELHNRNGMLGIGRCIQFAINEWIQDIQSTQLGDVIGSYGPITSLVQIGKGIRDLFIMPVDEYRKNDGHIVKGLQKGAESFGISTAAAAVDIAQQVVGLVQGVAELAFDIVTPDYPAYANRRRFANAISRRPPNDLREGFHMAYETVREGVTDTAQVLQLAAQEDRAEGYWPLRGLLRQVTPSILRPFVVASKATGHVLGGIKSQLKPDSHREELDKWKQTSNDIDANAMSPSAVVKYSRF